MTKNEKDLLNLIRENESPEQALLTAVLIIGCALEKCGQHQSQTVRLPLADVQQGHF